MQIRRLIVAVALSATLVPVRSADHRKPVAFRIQNNHGLVDETSLAIRNSNALDPFFEKLSRLRTQEDGVVSILHLGDSHIQADWMTGTLRENFQHDFGNAGRGLIVPARIAASNESPDIRSEAGGIWESKKILYPDQPVPGGIGGYTLSTTDTAAWLSIQMTDLKWSHQKLTLLYRKDPSSFSVAVRDHEKYTLAFVGNFTEEGKDASKVILPYPTAHVTLQIFKHLHSQSRFTFYGLSAASGQSGVLYHSSGVNGAKFRHYVAEPNIPKQAAILEPDLIILSLGTNEAADYPYQDPRLDEQISRLLNGLKNYCPGTPVVLTTPPGSFRKKSKRNPAITTIRNLILNQTGKNQVAVIDLWQAGGGEVFAQRWAKEKLMQADGIHFNREGYRLQGEMIYQALIDAYNIYVSH